MGRHTYKNCTAPTQGYTIICILCHFKYYFNEFVVCELFAPMTKSLYKNVIKNIFFTLSKFKNNFPSISADIWKMSKIKSAKSLSSNYDYECNIVLSSVQIIFLTLQNAKQILELTHTLHAKIRYTTIMMYNCSNIYEISIDLFLTIMTQKSLMKSGIFCTIIKSDYDDFFLHLVFLLIL